MWVIFDVETIPDAHAGRRWLDLGYDLSDHDVRETMLQRRMDETGSHSFLKPAFHPVVATAAGLVDETGALRKVASLGLPTSEESLLVGEFFRVIRESRPRLVGWNSGGFDLPVLVLRGMLHAIPAQAFYRLGEPYHGYRKRFDEESHIDLMDLLSGYGATARMSLDETASVLGVPGKLDTNGSAVMELFESGQIEAIRSYCETDVMTTALIFAAYARHREWMDADQAMTFDHSVQSFLTERHEVHWRKFYDHWMSLKEKPHA